MENQNATTKKSFFDKISKFELATLIFLLVFFIVGATTMGSFNSIGKSANLYKDDVVYFFLDYDANSSSKLQKVYFNFGAIQVGAGEKATVNMQYSTGSGSSISWSSSKLGSKSVANLHAKQVEQEGETAGKAETLASANNYNWLELYNLKGNEITTSYRLIKLTVSQETQINEIVFLGDNGKRIPAYSNFSSALDTKLKSKYTDGTSAYLNVKSLFTAGAYSSSYSNLLDAQKNFKFKDGWRYNFTQSEVYTLIQKDNLFIGNSAESDSVYMADTDFGSLSTLILSLGTLIFGTSTFGLRIMPLLFTTLLIGLIYLFIRKLLKSNAFAFLGAVLFALGGLALTVGRTGLGFSLLALLLLACYYFMYKFYENGVDNEKPITSALNILYSGLCFAGAFSIFAHSWIIALGAVALFALGVVKTVKNRKIAIEEAGENSYSVARQHNYNIKISVLFFVASFVFATFIVCILSVIPSYISYVRVYDDIASPKLSIFALVGKMLENTTNVSNLTTFTRANSINAFAWFISLKGATEYFVSNAGGNIAFNIQNNLAMTLTSLVGFIISTVYVITYLVAGGKNNPEYKKNFSKIANTYLVITAGSVLSALACAIIPATSVLYGMLFYVFYTAYIPLLAYIGYSHDKSKKDKFGLNNAMLVIFIALAVYLVLFLASLPMTFAFGMPEKLANVLFGWTSMINNGFFR